MAEQKTKPTEQDVEAFLSAIENDQKRQDAFAILQLMQDVTGESARMWGPSMVGFGSYHYQYASGHEGDSFVTGFSPRKDNFSLYIMGGFDRYSALLEKLGKFKTGKACLYVKKLADIDLEVLQELVKQSTAYIANTYPAANEPPM